MNKKKLNYTKYKHINYKYTNGGACPITGPALPSEGPVPFMGTHLNVFILILCSRCFLGRGVVSAAPLTSADWGFYVDPPAGYNYDAGDKADSYHFSSSFGGQLAFQVYPAGRYAKLQDAAAMVNSRFKNSGESESFQSGGKEAVIIELAFKLGNISYNGWALVLPLGRQPGNGAADNANDNGVNNDQFPTLVAMAYSPAYAQAEDLNLSALDSLAPTMSDLLIPGPVVSYANPRGARKEVSLTVPALDSTKVRSYVHEGDEVAAKSVVERENMVLQRYKNRPDWQDAWLRFYRMIYRDSYSRLEEVSFDLERAWDDNAAFPKDTDADRASANAALAAKALSWVQNFTYDRGSDGSDFINPVTAAIKGHADCDSRAMLMAIILSHAGVHAAMMVSEVYSHAMALVDVPGSGARFTTTTKLGTTQWLVGETTSHVTLGQIAQKMSDKTKWIGIVFN
jgi:hypothetical protein